MAGLSWAARDVTAYGYLNDHPEAQIRHLYFFADVPSPSPPFLNFEAKTSTVQGHSHMSRELLTTFLDIHPEDTRAVQRPGREEDLVGDQGYRV